MLLAGISHAVGAVVVGHSEVLEQPRHLQPRQAAGFQHPGQRRVKVGAERKTDAAHAGVGLEMDFDFSADSAGGLAEGLGLGQGVAGGGDVLLDEDGYTARLHMAQNEDGQRQPGFAQLTGFRQTAHSQPRGPLFSKDLGTLYGTVAVAVGPGLHGAEIVAQGVKVYLGPDVFFKCGHLHGLCPPFLMYGPGAKDASRRCRSPAEREGSSAGKHGRYGTAPGQSFSCPPGWSRRRQGSGS